MKIKEQDIEYDKSGVDDIIQSYEKSGHYKWFDYLDPSVKGMIPQDSLEDSLKNTLSELKKRFGYELKRVVVKDKEQIVGFFIWSDKGSYIDNIGDNKTYQVILSTAIHPEYRNRGLLKKMIEKSGIQRPYLVQTSWISPIGFWERMGCSVVKNMGNGNKIEKCD